MGVIVKAKDTRAQRIVALKILATDDFNSEDSIRFRREAQALAQLRHPNIVAINEFGQEQGRPYFSMNLIEGQSLKAELDAHLRTEGQGLPLDIAIERLQAIAEALAYCHDQGLVHRDLKPENIMVQSADQRPILVDFGLVRKSLRAHDGESIEVALTRSQTVLGTPFYMSPEQLGSDSKMIGPKSDVWSFGATLFHVLTGKQAFAGDSAFSVYAAITTKTPPRLRSIMSNAPQWLDQLIHDCLKQDPMLRPSMESIAELLASESLELEEPSPLRFLPWLIVPALVVLAAWLLWPRKELEVRWAQPEKLWVKDAKTVLWGKANIPGARVLVNGLSQGQADQAGQFRLPCNLVEGKQTLKLEVRSGSQSVLRDFDIVLDTKPPALSFEGQASEQVVVLKGSRLRGRVKDDWPGKRVVIEDDEVALSEAGEFSYSVAISNKPVALQIETKDRAGNLKRQRIMVYSPRVLRDSVDRLIDDARRWKSAARELQDLCIQRIARRMKKHYEFLSTDYYECAGQRFRIAAFRHKALKIRLHLIPGGHGRMGRAAKDAPPAFTNNAIQAQQEWDLALLPTPLHDVVMKPFLIAQTELTCKQWRLGGGKVPRPDAENPEALDLVSWKTVKGWLKKQAGGLRLPSESEWEYACRATLAKTNQRFYWGDRPDRKYVWTSFNIRPRKRPHAPEKHRGQHNAFGLVDMLGNVSEWCEDTFIINYKSGPSNNNARTESDTMAQAMSVKVLRGGSINSGEYWCECAERIWGHMTEQQPGQGFRVALSLPR